MNKADIEEDNWDDDSDDSDEETQAEPTSASIRDKLEELQKGQLRQAVTQNDDFEDNWDD